MDKKSSSVASEPLPFRSGLPMFDKKAGGLQPGLLVCVHNPDWREPYCDFGMTVTLANAFRQPVTPVLVLTTQTPVDAYRECLLYSLASITCAEEEIAMSSAVRDSLTPEAAKRL